MMRKILMRADDLGYSEAVNYGELKAVTDGLITCIGLMVNMPAAKHGVDLLQKTGILMGQHVNVSAGKPISDPAKIPSLVQANGHFKSSKQYNTAKEDLIDLDEMVLETEAQLARFIELTGHKPAYMDWHAVASANFFKGIEIVANRHGIAYTPVPETLGDLVTINQTQVLMSSGSTPEISAIDSLKQVLATPLPEDAANFIVYHPGYLDEYILKNSSLTDRRTYEVAMLCSAETKQLLQEHQVKLVSYNEL